MQQTERPHHQTQRTARRFAPRPGQLVIEFGVLELRQIQRQCLFENHDVDALAQLRPEQGLRERGAALCHGRRGHQQRLDGDVAQHVGQHRGARAAVHIGGVNHRIDDERADIRDAGRQHTSQECQHRKYDAERLVGGPHQRQRAPAVVEYVEQAPSRRDAGGGCSACARNGAGVVRVGQGGIT